MFGLGFSALWIAFILAAVAVSVLQSVLRRGGPPLRNSTGMSPYDVAYLSGGPERALLAAVTALTVAGLVTVQDGVVRAVGRSRAGLGALPQAVLAAARPPVPATELSERPGVAAALSAIETRLLKGGLLLSPERQRLIRMLGVVPLAVAALILVVAVWDTSAPHFVFALLFGFFAVLISARLLRRVPRRSRCGDRTLAKIGRTHRALTPQRQSSWAEVSAGTAALGVGLYGADVVQSCQPGLADALCVPQTGGDVFGSGDAGGWDAGGWGSGGWGSMGGADSGSSGWDSGSSGDAGGGWSSGGGDSGSSSGGGDSGGGSF